MDRSGQRRQGLAGRVLGLLEQRAAALGYTGLELTTGARQPEAVALYLRHGWIAGLRSDGAAGRGRLPPVHEAGASAGGVTGRATTGLE